MSAAEQHPVDQANGEIGTQSDDSALTRPQRRLLRRIYNGRTVPIVVDDMAFLTFREASRYLLSLSPEDRDAAYAEMKRQAL